MKSKALRIGVIGSGDDSSSKLLRLLVEQGMQVVHALVPKDLTDGHIAASDLDVWLLDLDDSHWHDQLDELMDRSPVPIFFNEHQSIEGQQHLDYWCRNLISRMFELVADVPGLPASAAAPAPAAAARASETLHIAFPADASQKKAESKPSDELNAPPVALDPELLQEIEELEHLLHSKTDHAAEFGELDDELPALTSAKAAAPARAAGASTEAAPTVKPAPEPSAATLTPAISPAPAPAADDPVAAAKIRAAKIQQQVAAAAQSREPATLAEVKPPVDKPLAPVPPLVSAAAATVPVAKAAPAPAKAPGAAEPKPSTATAAEMTPAGTRPAETRPAETRPAETTFAETKLADAKPAQTQSTESRPPEPASTASKPTPTAPLSAPKPAGLSLDATLAAAAAAPAPEQPPEKHDWPSFPQPASSGAGAADESAADFAPIQPPVAPGPMREPVRPSPMSLVRNVAPEAAAGHLASAADVNAAAAKSAVPSAPTAATPYSEPVPTLTVASDDEFEFEFVDQSAIDEPLPHVELDVPMLESVAFAGEFEAVAEAQPSLPCDLWILGASLGGPAALKRFFTALNQPLPICFLLAQHIDAHFLPVLGKILEQANPFYPVQVLVRPGLIEPGSLLLAPIEKRLRFLEAGQIVHSSKTWTPPYSPCIDDVLADVAGAYPGQVHTIVFSGMGEDGVDGAHAVAACRGEVWVQDTDSCASSVMPDAIDKAGLARYRATPEELAARLMARYNSALGSQSLA